MERAQKAYEEAKAGKEDFLSIAARYSDDTLDEIKALIRQYLGEGLRIEVIFEEQIEMVRTGKHLASVSKLPVDFQRSAPKVAAVTR